MTPGQDGAAERASKQRKTRIITAIVTVAVVAAGIVFFIVRNNQTSTTKADVGSCIEVQDASNTNDVKSKQQDCNNMAASYVVTETGEGVTCDSSEASIEQEGGVRVCLRPNVKSGDCATEDGNALKKIDCAAAGANDVKFVSVQEGTIDESKCPAGSVAETLKKRNFLYCLAPAKG